MKISGLVTAGFLAVAMAAGVPALAQQKPAPATPSAKATRPTEAPLRKFIADIAKGAPDYTTMAQGLADAVRGTPQAADRIKALGALKTLAYTETGPGGMDIYNATFEKGSLIFRIAMNAEGKIGGLLMQPAPAPAQ
ncbi:MAG TPA: hypothetical protein VGO52_24710 [Hyphomonadaceae bacterium]|jgi:hypothetical protein|nr:hypothetical protein [Hyphomonadaceae bacterium]